MDDIYITCDFWTEFHFNLKCLYPGNVCDSYLEWQNAPRPQARPAVLGRFGQVSFFLHFRSSFVIICHHLTSKTNRRTQTKTNRTTQIHKDKPDQLFWGDLDRFLFFFIAMHSNAMHGRSSFVTMVIIQ